MSLSVMDAFAEVPEKHRGKYDVVHMRLWCAVVQGGDPSALIRHATQLLSMYILLPFCCGNLKPSASIF